jgi:hypothetical protein
MAVCRSVTLGQGELTPTSTWPPPGIQASTSPSRAASQGGSVPTGGPLGSVRAGSPALFRFTGNGRQTPKKQRRKHKKAQKAKSSPSALIVSL